MRSERTVGEGFPPAPRRKTQHGRNLRPAASSSSGAQGHNAGHNDRVPLIAGGQGRTARAVEDDATGAMTVAVLAFTAAVVFGLVSLIAMALTRGGAV